MAAPSVQGEPVSIDPAVEADPVIWTARLRTDPVVTFPANGSKDFRAGVLIVPVAGLAAIASVEAALEDLAVGMTDLAVAEDSADLVAKDFAGAADSEADDEN